MGIADQLLPLGDLFWSVFLLPPQSLTSGLSGPKSGLSETKLSLSTPNQASLTPNQASQTPSQASQTRSQASQPKIRPLSPNQAFNPKLGLSDPKSGLSDICICPFVCPALELVIILSSTGTVLVSRVKFCAVISLFHFTESLCLEKSILGRSMFRLVHFLVFFLLSFLGSKQSPFVSTCHNCVITSNKKLG